MKKFFISYDLVGRNRNQDYQQIENLLINANAERVLINLWVYEGDRYQNTVNVRDALRSYMSNNDRLLVIEATEWAWYNAANSENLRAS